MSHSAISPRSRRPTSRTGAVPVAVSFASAGTNDTIVTSTLISLVGGVHDKVVAILGCGACVFYVVSDSVYGAVRDACGDGVYMTYRLCGLYCTRHKRRRPARRSMYTRCQKSTIPVLQSQLKSSHQQRCLQSSQRYMTWIRRGPLNRTVRLRSLSFARRHVSNVTHLSSCQGNVGNTESCW